MMKSLGILVLLLAVAAGLVVGAPSTRTAVQIIVLSNSTPHVSVIDAASNRIIKTADIPRMTTWTWNDDNNYYDGKHLWLGLRNPDTNDVEVILLDLDTLQVSKRIPLGQDKTTLYIGKPSRHGRLLVAKHASGEIAAIDRKTYTVTTAKVPVNGGVACDIDLGLGAGGSERAFIPTNDGNTVVSVDTKTLRAIQTVSFPNSQPFMLTVTPDGKRIWVEERLSNSVAVLKATTLELVTRIPMGKVPIVGTFSPDGKVHYTGHIADVVVVAHDASTFKELWRSSVGSNPDKLGVHPAGTFVYATLSNEGAIAVLDAHTGHLVARISLGTNPSGIFVRSGR